MKPLLRRFSPDGAALWYYVRLFLGSIILAWSLNLLAEIQPQTIPEPLWCLVKVSPGDPVLVWSLCIFIFIIQNILIKLINNLNDLTCLWLSCPVTPWNPEWCFMVLSTYLLFFLSNLMCPDHYFLVLKEMILIQQLSRHFVCVLQKASTPLRSGS